MCQVNVRSCGNSGRDALVGVVLAGGAVALVVSVVGSVILLAVYRLVAHPRRTW